MEDVTDKAVFQVFTEEDSKTRDHLSITKCVQLLEEKFNIQLTEEQKDNVKTSLKRYHSLKKRRYTEKRVPINWVELSSLGEAKDVVFCYKPSTSASRKRPLEELDSRKQLLRRTNEIWADIQAVAAKESVTSSQLLGLLLTRLPDQGSRDFGNSLWNKSARETNEKLSVGGHSIGYVH